MWLHGPEKTEQNTPIHVIVHILYVLYKICKLYCIPRPVGSIFGWGVLHTCIYVIKWHFTSLTPGLYTYVSPCNYILHAEPTFMRAQKCPIYLGMHTYSILKVHICLQLGIILLFTAAYGNLTRLTRYGAWEMRCHPLQNPVAQWWDQQVMTGYILTTHLAQTCDYL